MSSSILKFGQIIRIRSDEFANCFLSSKSYTDQNIYFQTYDKEQTYISGGLDVINISNYRQALFEILPTSSFQINDQMNSQRDEAKKAQSAPRAQTEADQFQAMISQKRGKYISFGSKVIFKHVDSGYYLYGSWDCASAGIGAFKIELKKQLSEKIIFQLMSYRTYEKQSDEMSIYAPFKIYHCETQCYVSYCYQKMFVDNGMAKRYFGNLNGIESPQLRQYYYKEGEQQLQGDQKISASGRKQILPKTGRFLIINQNIHRRVFKLQVHNQFEMKPNKQKIRNHDIVYFINTSEDQYICPSISQSNIFLKKRLQQSDLADIFDGLWEIEEIKTLSKKQTEQMAQGRSKASRKQTKKIGNQLQLPSMGTAAHLNMSFLTQTVGAPVVQGQLGADAVSGSPSNNDDDDDDNDKQGKKKQKYILRHLCSGRIMYVSSDLKRVDLQEFQGNSKKPILLSSVDNKLQDGALVQFSYKKRGLVAKKFIKYYLNIIKNSEKAQQQIKDDVIRQDIEYEQGYSVEQDLQAVSNKKIVQEYNSRFSKAKLGLTIDASQHGFRIYKISQQAKQLCLFVLSSQEIISKFTQLIEQYRTLDQLCVELKVPLLNNVINVFKNLVGFIYDCDYNKIAQSGNNPNSKKQRIFDELGMIQLVTRMLDQINRRDPQIKKKERFEGDPQDGQQQFINRLQDDPQPQRLSNLSIKNKNSQYKKVRTVYELGYKLLESVAAGNYLMKIKISKYMNHYLDQILKKANRGVYCSIQQFLDSNYLALEEITDDYIQDLIKHLDKNDPDPADLYFLSRLCLCKDRTVPKNQIAVFNAFYKQENQQKSFNKYSMQESLEANQFKFREDQKKMQIFSKITPSVEPQYRTLSQLYEECNLMKFEGGYDPDKNHWAYFMRYLNLLADVCVQRNISPLKYIEKNLPLKTLVAFLHEGTVKKNLLFQPFIRLVHHAFVQTSEYEQINRITKVKMWDELGKFNIPIARKTPQEELKKTMNLIIEYIRRINKKAFTLRTDIAQLMDKQKENQGEQGAIKKQEEGQKKQPDTIDFDVDDRDRLVNVKTFLEILKSTLNLGFWYQINQMKKMVPFLLKIMRFDIEYADKMLVQKKHDDKKQGINQFLNPHQYRQLVYGTIKQQVKLNKPNILLLVQCKILAAKIISIIIDYEYNVRVSMITKYFKDVMEIDVNLSKYKYDKMQFISKWKNHIQYSEFAPMNEKEGYLLLQDLWKDKVCEIIQSRNLFSQCIAESINPSLVFFQTFVYSNQQLTNISLEIVNRITNQRQEILRTFKDIIFVAGGHLKKLAVRGVDTTRSVLLNLISPNVINYDNFREILYTIPRPGYVPNESQKLGVVQQLASLTMSMMKSRANPTPSDSLNFYQPTQLYPFTDIFGVSKKDQTIQYGSYLIISQKDENLQLNQNLIKSQDHHLLIVDFIKLMSQLPTQHALPMRALHAAYNFLTTLVWNNKQNKKQLQWILKLAQKHVKFNVGCIDFFKVMYTNNMNLVKKSDIKPIINLIIDQANQLELVDYQKSKLLDFLRIAVIFDDQGYDINQNMVMEKISQIQVSAKNSVVYLKAEGDIFGSLSSNIEKSYTVWIKQYMIQYRQATENYSSINVSAPLFYITTFFQVFSALIQNQNVVNIGKASNMHPLDFLHKILKESQRCWIVIRHLRAYLNRLYYFQKRTKDSALFNSFINEDLPIIKQELQGIVQLVCNAPDYNVIRIKNPVRYCYLGSYVFLSLQQILHSLNLFIKEDPKNKTFQNHLNLTISQASDTKLVYLLVEIIEILQYLLKTIDGRYINKYMARVSKRLRSFLANTPFRVVKQYEDLSKELTNMNIDKYKISTDDIPFKKSYLFHDAKSFWRHFIDWNSFKDQQEDRDAKVAKVQKRVQPNPGETKEALEQRQRDYLLQKIFLGNIDKRIQRRKTKPPPVKQAQQRGNKGDQEGQKKPVLPKNVVTSQSVHFKVKTQFFASASDKNILINQRRKKLAKFLTVNDQFNKFTNQELSQQFYDVFSALNDTSSKCYQEIVIVGTDDVIKSIVKMNQLDPQSIKFQYKLLTIRLLTNYIQRNSDVFGEQIQNWGINCVKNASEIKTAQDFLYDCGVASFLSSLLIVDLRSTFEMAKAILLLGISLLLNKNANNQNQLFKLIQQDQINQLLVSITRLIKDCGSSIAAYNVGAKAVQYNPTGIIYSDTYDFYIDNQRIMGRKFVYHPETVLEQKQFDEKVVNMQYAFIFLKNLCEGNIQIKQYIRDQKTTDEQKKTKPDSVNFLMLGVTELKRMFSNFKIDIIKVPFSIIDFIYEVTQIPCLQNQRFICKSSMFSDFAILQQDITKMLQKNILITNQKNILIIFNIFSSNIKNVISCLQGNKQDIYQSFSSEVLCRYFVNVLAFYIKYLPTVQNIGQITSARDLQIQLNKKKLHQSFYLDMFQATSVIVKLSKKTPVKQFDTRIKYNLKSAAGINMQQIFDLLKQNLLGIEIRMDGDQLQTLFFPKHKVLTYLSRATRTNIMEYVDRSTQRDKIIGLLQTKSTIVEQFDYNYSLDNQFTIFKVPFSITTAKIESYFNLGLQIALLICILTAYFTTVVYYPYQQEIQFDLGAQTIIMKGLSITQFIIAMTYFFLWLKTHLFLAIKKYQRAQQQASKESGQQQQSALFSFMLKIPGFKSLYCIKQDEEFGNMILFMFGSFMGMFYGIEWFSILLMNLLMARLEVLKNILTALKVSLPMLAMLSFLGTSFVAFFSVFSLYYYAGAIYPDKFPDDYCQSVPDCIVQLYIKEEIGSQLQSFQGGRFAYDMVYSIFMGTLFSNIIGGVLIDNFASLREDRQKMLKDKTQKCFICGIERETLQKKNLTLKTHYIQQYHKLWNYVFYLYHLDKQIKKTGLEDIIIKKFEGQDVSWLPLAQSGESGIGDLLAILQQLMLQQQKSLKVIEIKQ